MMGNTHVQSIIVPKDEFELCGKVACCSADDAESNGSSCKTGTDFSIRGDWGIDGVFTYEILRNRKPE